MLENTLHFETAKSEQISAYARRMSDELGDIGYYALPDIGKHESLERIKNKYKTKQNVVLIGVGGSSLGAKAYAIYYFRRSPSGTWFSPILRLNGN